MRERIQDNWDIEMRLSDVSAGTAIVAKCGRCNQRRALDRNTLAKRFGRDARLIRLELVLRCRRCRTGAACRLQLQMLPRD